MALVAWCVVAMGAMAQTTVPVTPGDDAGVQSITQFEHLRCPDALFRILPGAFDYCVAMRHWSRGKYAESLDMLERAAAWGHKDAQLALGIAYFNGDQVAMNRPLGLAWLGLAAERQEARSLQLLASAYAKATPQEQQRAQALMTRMWPTYADQHAAVRADRVYQRAIRSIGDRSAYGVGLCLDGITTSPVTGMNAQEAANTIGCPSVANVVRTLDTLYAGTMRGWSGTVTVGRLAGTRIRDEQPSANEDAAKSP